MRKGGLGLPRWAVPREPGGLACPVPPHHLQAGGRAQGVLQPIGARVGTYSRPERARGVQGRVEGPGGQGPLPALPALASPRCLGAWVPGAARIATFPRGRGRGCPGRLAVSTELASASWGWLGELVPSTRSCLQRPVPQAVCVLLREPQKLLERWAWPGAIFLLQSPWEGSRAPLRTARLSQHRRSLCPASEARTAACMGSWAPVLGSQSWWG